MTLTCRICKVPTKPPYLLHCQEHYKCADCGTLDGLVTRGEGVLCDPCHKARVEKRVSEFKGDTNYTREVVCPNCGYEYRDSFEMREGEQECGDCGRTFELTRNLEITYSTSKP